MGKIEDIRNESPEELDLKLITLKKEIFKLRSEQLENKSKQTHLISTKRKEISRILTIKRERELAQELAQEVVEV